MSHSFPPVRIRVSDNEFITIAPGIVISNLKQPIPCGRRETAEAVIEYNAAIDGLESLLLALATEGQDVSSPAFQRAVITAMEKISEELS